MEELLKLLPAPLQIALILFAAVAFVVVVLHRAAEGWRDAGKVVREPDHAIIEGAEVADLGLFRKAVERQDAVLDAMKSVISLSNRVDSNGVILAEILVMCRREESAGSDRMEVMRRCLDILEDQKQQAMVEEKIEEKIMSRLRSIDRAEFRKSLDRPRSSQTGDVP